MKIGFFTKLCLIFLTIFSIFFMFDIVPSLLNKDIDTKRILALRKNQNAISIAVVSPKGKHKKDFIHGLKVAQQKINSKAEIPFNFYMDFYEEEKGTAIKIARDLTHTAVLGYSNSELSQSAGMIFTESNLLFMHFCTSSAIKSSNIRKSFSIVPSNNVLAKAAIKSMKDRNLKRAYVVYSRKEHYGELHSALYPSLIKTDIKITGKFSYFEDKVNFSQLISDFDKSKFDCIIFAGDPDNFIHFVNNFRNLGFKKFIIYPEKLGDDLVRPLLSKKQRKDLLIIKGFDIQERSSLNFNFIKSFTSLYDDEIPNQWSALAFESLILLADVVKHTNSNNPYDLASFLNFNEKFVGLSDTLTFNKDGELDGRSIYTFEFINDRIISKKYFILE